MNIRIFDRYIWRQVFGNTLIGIIVLSGVMVLGNVYQKLDQLLGDTHLPMMLIVKFIGLVIPYSLIFIIPFAFLTGILLVFGRMSADNEMVSLRMTGQPMWRICAPVFFLALLLSLIGFWVNASLAPAAKSSMKHLFYDLATSNPINMFPEGRVLDKFPGYRIYTGRVKDEDTVEDLQIFQLDGNYAKQFICAKSADIVRKPGELDFMLRLKIANMEQVVTNDSGMVEKVDSGHFSESYFSFPLSELKGKMERVNASMKSTSDLSREVSTHIDTATQAEMDRKAVSVSRTELHKRYSFSLACLTFAFIGIPLGMTAQRRETTMGFILSLVTALVYFGFIMFADAMNEKYRAYPHLLMWLPNLLFLGIGGWMFYKLSKK